MKAFKRLDHAPWLEQVELPAQPLNVSASLAVNGFLNGYHQACWELAHLEADGHYYLNGMKLTEVLNRGPRCKDIP